MPRRRSSQRLPSRLINSWAVFARFLAQAYQARLEHDLLAALKLYHWLKANPVTVRPLIPWRDPIYRVIYGSYDPLSIAGSLSDGGRFNVGGAQQLPSNLMPLLRKAACLYGASTATCAVREAATPIGKYRVFELTPKRKFKLWNLKTVLSATSYPGLAARVNATPMSQRWGLQKSPLESQILAHHLRDIGGDGILHDSQKDPPGKTLAIFLKDDQDSHQTFVVA